MTDILRDWCRTAFATAASPMYDYYLAMDRAWGAMPIHARILEGAVDKAPLLLAGKLPERAAAAFAEAERSLPQSADPAARRAAATIARERAFFKQWQNLDCMCHTDDPRRLDVPLRLPDAGAGQFYSKVLSFGDPAVQARLAWTAEALLIQWDCRGASGGDAFQNDRVELALADGVSGGTWYFSADRQGVKQARRESGAGVRDNAWNPDWQVRTHLGPGGWEAEMTIPFGSLGQSPIATESWECSFARHHDGRNDTFPAGGATMLFFSTAPRTDRTVLWWLGWESSRDAWLTGEFTTALGYELRLVRQAADLSALRRLHGLLVSERRRPPEDTGGLLEQDLGSRGTRRRGSRFGATPGVPIPLEKYFDDPSCKVRHKHIDGLFERQLIAPHAVHCAGRLERQAERRAARSEAWNYAEFRFHSRGAGCLDGPGHHAVERSRDLPLPIGSTLRQGNDRSVRREYQDIAIETAG